MKEMSNHKIWSNLLLNAWSARGEWKQIRSFFFRELMKFLHCISFAFFRFLCLSLLSQFVQQSSARYHLAICTLHPDSWVGFHGWRSRCWVLLLRVGQDDWSSGSSRTGWNLVSRCRGTCADRVVMERQVKFLVYVKNKQVEDKSTLWLTRILPSSDDSSTIDR